MHITLPFIMLQGLPAEKVLNLLHFTETIEQFIIDCSKLLVYKQRERDWDFVVSEFIATFLQVFQSPL